MSRKARVALPSTPDHPSVPRPRIAPDEAARWRALFGSEPPPAATLVGLGIAWREQVNVAGDVAPAVARDLAIAARQAREGRGVTPSDPVGQDNAASFSGSTLAGSRSGAPCSRNNNGSGPSAASRIIPVPVTEPAPSPRSAAPRSKPRTVVEPLPPASSQLLPGTRLVKAHGGRNHVVQVTDTGFVYEGAAFASLSAVAKHITGTHWNGLLFFGLRRRKTYPARVAANG